MSRELVWVDRNGNIEPVGSKSFTFDAEETFDHFGKVIGFEFLKGMHLNDSKKELGTRVDRHDNLGNGYLGIEPFKWIMADNRFNDIPMVLETPDDSLWEEEIALLKSFVN